MDRFLLKISAIITILMVTNSASAQDGFSSARLQAVTPNAGANFPISIGRITISDTASAPFYLFNAITLNQNSANTLLDALKAHPTDPAAFDSVLPGTGILKSLADSALTAQGFTIQASSNATNFFTINAAYSMASDSAGNIVSRLLTLSGKSPYVDCQLQFNIQAFIQKLVQSPGLLAVRASSSVDIEFKWMLINLAFDTGGSYLVIDSIDIHCTYMERKPNALPRATTAHISRQIGLRTKRPNPLWSDASIFNSTCFAPQN